MAGWSQLGSVVVGNNRRWSVADGGCWWLPAVLVGELDGCRLLVVASGTGGIIYAVVELSGGCQW